MTTPNWISAAVRDFGRGAGIDDFVLNDRGVAAIRFENGISFRMEYLGERLSLATTVKCPNDPSTARRILSVAHPDARFGFRIRSGYLPKTGCAMFASILAAEEVTLPILNTVFGALWRAATEFGGAA